MTQHDDDLDLFGEAPTERHRPVRRDSRDRGDSRDRRDSRERRGRKPPPPPKKKRRTGLWIGMVLVLALIAAGGYYGYKQLTGIGDYEDFAGQGEGDVVIQVQDGDSTGDIATTLVDAGVVASSRAFVAAAESNADVRGVQPGYYVMKKNASGAAAVTKIVNPESRVGALQIKPGAQFEDIKLKGDKVVKGITSMLADASCAELDGKSTCVQPAQLLDVVVKADLAKLGVPDWAVPDAAKAEPKRRLEGLIMPGVYDVKPGSTPEELWQQLVSQSAMQMQAYGLPDIATDTGYTPYQVLVMASLVEKEAVTKDFGKVSRVTYNRLRDSMKLQYDSTINYVLDRPMIRTTAEDRARVGPYNTYGNTGLPPTPISAPGKEAIEAAVKPEPGDWLFFVVCEKDGTSCFAKTNDEHERNVDLANERDAY
ncbi:endolytic transglycosylase MltG [Actinophytocola sp. NPDC049390]|uniref:endolytic transglycosylase MltG n=1 Tax=Actinophytocola sp. NPDC049390 TaxID=3363894 RepID=UPI0037B7B034